MTHPFPYPAGTDVRLVVDPGHTTTVVEVFDDHAELCNGSLYAASELLPAASDERWLPLREYETRYRVSSHGKLLSLAYRSKPRQRLLKPSHAGPNTVATYKLPGVSDYKLAVTASAGQLVAAHFLPPPGTDKPHHVRYLDGNRRNLRSDNLAWYDTTDTTDEAVKVYLRRGRAYGQPTALLSAAQAAEACVLIAQKEAPYKAIAARYGVSEGLISSLAKNSGLATPRDNRAQHESIHAALAAGEAPVAIARRHGVHRNTVWRLARGLTCPPAAGR